MAVVVGGVAEVLGADVVVDGRAVVVAGPPAQAVMSKAEKTQADSSAVLLFTVPS